MNVLSKHGFWFLFCRVNKLDLKVVMTKYLKHALSPVWFILIGTTTMWAFTHLFNRWGIRGSEIEENLPTVIEQVLVLLFFILK